MTRTILLLTLQFTCIIITAQSTKPVPDSFAKLATVDITVTDMNARPRKGEEVLFRGENTGKLFTTFSDGSGKSKQRLPPGDKYFVSVKSISDTTKYAVIIIPALAEDEYFTEPFWVNIKFDPPRKYRLDNVHFDFDKASLRPDSYDQLTELLEYLQRHQEIRIEIAGHTDNAGTEAHNLKLSQDRANTIRDYLVRKGIKITRLTAKGYGATEPVANNSTEEGRQLNRRTEVRVL
jgi:OmpA-OmpF porin, OOP family